MNLGFATADEMASSGPSPERGEIQKPRATPWGNVIPRDKPHRGGICYYALKALDCICITLPRALPWAVEFRPIRGLPEHDRLRRLANGIFIRDAKAQSLSLRFPCGPSDLASLRLCVE